MWPPGTARFSVPYRNSNGPLLVLPKELLAHWSGIDKPEDGRLIHTEWDDILGECGGGSDYARALSAEEDISMIAVGPSHGILLGPVTAMDRVQWLSVDDKLSILLVIPGGAYNISDHEPALLDVLDRVGETGWLDVTSRFQVDQQDLVLMHSTDNGKDVLRYYGAHELGMVGANVPHGIVAGTYSVMQQHFNLSEDRCCVICRIRPADHSAWQGVRRMGWVI